MCLGPEMFNDTALKHFLISQAYKHIIQAFSQELSRTSHGLLDAPGGGGETKLLYRERENS